MTQSNYNRCYIFVACITFITQQSNFHTVGPHQKKSLKHTGISPTENCKTTEAFCPSALTTDRQARVPWAPQRKCWRMSQPLGILLKWKSSLGPRLATWVTTNMCLCLACKHPITPDREPASEQGEWKYLTYDRSGSLHRSATIVGCEEREKSH